jgi:hypothetical protein
MWATNIAPSPTVFPTRTRDDNISNPNHCILNIRPERQGGFQGLIERLQNSVNEDGRIYVSQDDVDRIKDYHNKYGGGGFQGRLVQIFGAHIDFDA